MVNLLLLVRRYPFSNGHRDTIEDYNLGQSINARISSQIKRIDIAKVTFKFFSKYMKFDKGKSLKGRSHTSLFIWELDGTLLQRAGRWLPSRDQTSLRDENRSECRALQNNDRKKVKERRSLRASQGKELAGVSTDWQMCFCCGHATAAGHVGVSVSIYYRMDLEKG